MTLYDLIAELRREHQSPAASKTLDMVMVELGKTRDNLRSALNNLKNEALPPGGEPILKELEERADRAGLDDLDYPQVEMKGFRPPLEEADEGSLGIAVLLTLTAVIIVGLAAAAIAAGVSQLANG
jgi:hypothetical protein